MTSLMESLAIAVGLLGRGFVVGVPSVGGGVLRGGPRLRVSRVGVLGALRLLGALPAFLLVGGLRGATALSLAVRAAFVGEDFELLPVLDDDHVELHLLGHHRAHASLAGSGDAITNPLKGAIHALLNFSDGDDVDDWHGLESRVGENVVGRGGEVAGHKCLVFYLSGFTVGGCLRLRVLVAPEG